MKHTTRDYVGSALATKLKKAYEERGMRKMKGAPKASNIPHDKIKAMSDANESKTTL